MRRLASILMVTCSLLIDLSVQAMITLPKIFTSNMVLQRDKPLTIWGWADKSESVTVNFNGQKAKAKADKSGEWQVTLKSMPAGGPFEMNIEGKNRLSLSNILLGDVYVCSGQSNMEWVMNNVNGAQKEISEGAYPNIRLFTVPRAASFTPAKDLPGGEWLECTPANLGQFSAVAYFFGRRLHKDLNVPIGLLNTNWGGTNVQSWLSWDVIRKKEPYQLVDISKMEREKVEADIKHLEPNIFPSQLYNAMVAPVIRYAIKGAIWYQGESNTGESYKYRTLFPEMINDWRSKWKDEFPFFWVQLANFMQPDSLPAESGWAELREAQSMTLSLPKTGQAVIIDIGEAGDIHPRNKQDVGLRLALAAEKVAYDKDIVYSGPVYQSMKTEGNRITLNFANTGSGLIAKDKYGYLKAFAIAGADRKFVWAKAMIQGNQVVVYNEQVTNPVAVRYAWGNNPGDADLYNREGLPASPFRTDEWPGITEGRSEYR